MKDESETKLFALIILICLFLTGVLYVTVGRVKPERTGHQVILFPHPENAS